MLLRIKQVRSLPDGKPGSNIDLTPKGSATKVIVQFRPLDPNKPDVDHVADVTDQQQLAKLLAIPDGFEIHPEAVKAAGKIEKAKATTEGAASSVAASGVAGASTTSEPPAPPAPGANAVSGGEKPSDAPEGEKKPEDMTKAELIAAVKEKTGKAPHPSTSEKKLREQLK